MPEGCALDCHLMELQRTQSVSPITLDMIPQRPDNWRNVKVLDCTIRDGGLMNNWQFDDDFVKACYDACVAAGVDIMEIGYLSSAAAFCNKKNGPWKFCHNKDLTRIVGKNNTRMKLSAMADIGRISHSDIPYEKDSVLDIIRVACYVHQVREAIALAEHCVDKGYEVTIDQRRTRRRNYQDGA